MRFKTVKGMRDLLPEDATKLNKIIEIFRKTFEKYGFSPLYTPAIENFELLASKGGLGEAIKEEIYYFKDKSNRELGLRFDLTMPLARVFISQKFPLPFKRYQIEKVWRYDEPQAKRWREFWQADIDIIGSSSVIADLECMACACECLENLGIKNFFIRVNDRKIFEKILEKIGYENNKKDIMRIVDKLDRLGEKKVLEEFKKIKVNGEKILNSLKQTSISDESFKEVSKNLLELLEYSKYFGINDKIKVDLTLVRGLDYYSGLVYEISFGENVSFGGGGRYDNLIKSLGGQDTPATGISLGLDRIVEFIKEKNIEIDKEIKPKIFLANVSNKKEIKNYLIKVVSILRKNSITCEFDLMDRKFKKQLSYASNKKIPYVIIIGEEEYKNNLVKLKDMKSGNERLLSVMEAISFLKG